ncbi:MAG: hypothetical protein Q9201_007220 [Fulgogasparrea decipioides]
MHVDIVAVVKHLGWVKSRSRGSNSYIKDTDPTAGYVDYVDGQSSGLFSQSGGSVKLAVDSSSVASGRGRKSVRVTSKASYNHALIVLDIGHMPGNICGVWPAL